MGSAGGGKGGEFPAGGEAGSEGLSRHPTDRLIRELIQTRRAATTDEVAKIRERIATAPFRPDRVRAIRRYRGLRYQGRVVRNREESLFLHLIQRVVFDEEWADGTTAGDYLDDLHRAATDPSARIVIYRRSQRMSVGVFGPNNFLPPHRGSGAEPFLYVVYPVDNGWIVTGYQVNDLVDLDIPGDAQWLS